MGCVGYFVLALSGLICSLKYLPPLLLLQREAVRASAIQPDSYVLYIAKRRKVQRS